MQRRYFSTPAPEPDMLICTTCGVEFPQHYDREKKDCSACEFVGEVLAQAKMSCGTVVVQSYMLWVIPDATTRFEQRGWTIDLDVPSTLDVWRGKMTIRVKANDVGCCSGKADATPRCYATSCGAIPSPGAVRDVKQATCRSNCPVAAFSPKTNDIDALTRRCCTALSQVTVDPVKVKIEREDVPALASAVANLRASGWTVSVTDTFEKRSLGNIQIFPQLSEATATC